MMKILVLGSTATGTSTTSTDAGATILSIHVFLTHVKNHYDYRY
jgi:hypothetical protein